MQKRHLIPSLLLALLLILIPSAPLRAQDALLQRYTEMGDINTTHVSRGMLDLLPPDQLALPGLQAIASRIESMTILQSMGDKAGKQMGAKLPQQLKSQGFEERLATTRPAPQGRGRQDIRILQSRRDPSRVVFVLYQKPQATVVSLKGDFQNLDIQQLLPQE